MNQPRRPKIDHCRPLAGTGFLLVALVLIFLAMTLICVGVGAYLNR